MPMMDKPFAGGSWLPAESSKRIQEDHLERYRFAARFAPGRRVLDIACGPGYGTKLLADAGAREAEGVDLDEQAVAYASEHFGSATTVFRQGDICTYHGSPPYDLITSFETIEHVDDYGKALHNLHGLLSDEGVLVMSTPNRLITSPRARSLRDRPSNRFHVREFTVRELHSALLDHGFAVKEGNIFGQRQQPYFRNYYVRKLYARLFNPKERASPVVTRVDRLTPRYLIIVAEKAARG
jgi:cyclopropane fatty-acyl-phospholipid synthase-like methyltransferase